MTEFSELPLKPELIDSLKRIGFVTATDVQERSIPELLQGKNAIVRAKSGTGKTGAFIVPIMQKIEHSRDVEALVIVPTRELAVQVASFASQVGGPLHVRPAVIYGGASMNVQMSALRSGANIVIGTPGRIIDLFKRGALRLERVKTLVLDEADVMLDMGFITDVEFIISKTPRDRQFLLFSATMPKEIVKLAEGYSGGDIARIIVGEEEDITVSTISHSYAVVPKGAWYSALLAYIKDCSPRKTVIFARTKYEADAVYRVLTSQNYDVMLLHGGLTQSARERSLSSFKGGSQFLVATNVAARGIDVFDINDVINLGAPDDPKTYVHRVGRSARMGKDGRALTIIDRSQISQLSFIEEYANVTMHEIKLNFEQFANLNLPIREGGRRGPSRSGGGRFQQSGGGRRGQGRGGSDREGRWGEDRERGKRRPRSSYHGSNSSSGSKLPWQT